MALIIDRFEGDYAVVEVDGEKTIDIPRYKLPAEAKEGDVLAVNNDIFSLDTEETKRIKDEAEKLMSDLWK